METSSEASAFDRGVAPILTLVLPQHADSVVDYHPDDKLQQRIDDLAAKSNEGELTPEERAEYVGYVRANKFVAVLKRLAQRHLPNAPRQ